MGKPTPEPTRGILADAPSELMLTQNQMQLDGVENLDNCHGKSRKQCYKDPACKFQRPSRICVKVESMPITETHLVPIKPASNNALPLDSTCQVKAKKQCVRDPECIWIKPSCVHILSSGKTLDEKNPKHMTSGQNCGEAKWHPKSATDRRCSNSPDYPSLWDTDTYSGQHLS